MIVKYKLYNKMQQNATIFEYKYNMKYEHAENDNIYYSHLYLMYHPMGNQLLRTPATIYLKLN